MIRGAVADYCPRGTNREYFGAIIRAARGVSTLLALGPSPSNTNGLPFSGLAVLLSLAPALQDEVVIVNEKSVVAV